MPLIQRALQPMHAFALLATYPARQLLVSLTLGHPAIHQSAGIHYHERSTDEVVSQRTVFARRDERTCSEMRDHEWSGTKR